MAGSARQTIPVAAAQAALSAAMELSRIMALTANPWDVRAGPEALEIRHTAVEAEAARAFSALAELEAQARLRMGLLLPRTRAVEAEAARERIVRARQGLQAEADRPASSGRSKRGAGAP